MNRKWIVWMGFWLFALPWCVIGVSASEPVTVVEKEFLWSSPNLEETEIPGPPAGARKGIVQKGPALGDFAYKTYFDRNGTPPPYPFLRPLKEGSPFARIVGSALCFQEAEEGSPDRHPVPAPPREACGALPALRAQPGTPCPPLLPPPGQGEPVRDGGLFVPGGEGDFL